MTAPADGRLTLPQGAAHLLPQGLAHEARVAVVAADYHAAIVSRLLDGAVATLEEAGLERERITVATAPGAFELPLVARAMAATGAYAAVVTLGCVIRGGTPHFDYVCAEAARGVADASRATGVPIAFGVLTCDTVEQAEERAGGAHGNKGREAAAAALHAAGTLSSIGR